MQEELIKKISDKEDRLLLKKVLDKYNLYKKKNISTYSNFLNPRELLFLENYLKYLKVPYNIYKIFPFEEKSIIYFGEYLDFISIFEIDNPNLKHKDVLGALYGSGYTTDMIGDIYICDKVYLTNLEKYDTLLISNLDKIGSYNVSLIKLDYIPDIKQNFTNISIRVNSLRIDLFISKLLSISRSQVIKFLNDKNVYVNYKRLNSNSYNINECDVISIESVGKFIIDEVSYIERNKKYIIIGRKYS